MSQTKTAARQTTVGRIDPAVLNFTAGGDAILDRALIAADCIGSAAHATMLARLPKSCRVLRDAECRAVIRELGAIVREAGAGKFEIRVEDQDVHLAVERRLTAKLGQLGKKVHTARSRNDQVATDLRLYTRTALFDLREDLAELAQALLRFARRNARLPMVGRTHMQPAMPSSVGLWASAHAESLLDDGALLAAVAALNDRCPLGSAASYGVPLPIDRNLTARLLGFSAPIHNVLAAGNARGKIESTVLGAAVQVMLSLGRYAADLMLYTMPEFGYFRFPPEFGTGSSIMPQKNNPDVVELVRARAARVLAAHQAVTQITMSLPSGYNRDLQETKGLFFDGLATTRACVRVMTLMTGGLRADRAALLRGFTPPVFATDRALELVSGGMPFRDAYLYVKAHLGELRNVNPAAALARKVHLGAPAGLDFGALEARSRAEAAGVRRARKQWYRKVSSLMKMPYPPPG